MCYLKWIPLFSGGESDPHRKEASPQSANLFHDPIAGLEL